MTEQLLNAHGDQRKFIANGHGADIASQRADDLDLLAVAHAEKLGTSLALDIACGAGGQAKRLAEAGATVIATDVIDMADAIQASSPATPGRITFAQQDMRELDSLHVDFPADIIVCQRAIHYLPYAEAVPVLQKMAKMLASDGRLYISASGIHSELGNDYTGKGQDLTDRYTELAPAMADKHGIHGPVCLYSESDLVRLIEDAGLQAEKIFSSSFGNIKAVAKHV